MKKILLISDSTSNPRSSSMDNNETYFVNETFFYKLKKVYKEAVIHQITFGSLSTKKLLVEAQSYFIKWEPDIIIIHSGINDCKPSVIREINKDKLINKFGYLMKYIKPIIYNPKLIKFFNITSSTKDEFEKNIKIFKSLFQNSRIFWLEISCEDKLEKKFPGVLKNKNDFNKVLYELFGNDFIQIEKSLIEKKGFSKDHLHYNANGHNIIYDLIKEKINH